MRQIMILNAHMVGIWSSARCQYLLLNLLHNTAVTPFHIVDSMFILSLDSRPSHTFRLDRGMSSKYDPATRHHDAGLRRQVPYIPYSNVHDAHPLKMFAQSPTIARCSVSSNQATSLSAFQNDNGTRQPWK